MDKKLKNLKRNKLMVKDGVLYIGYGGRQDAIVVKQLEDGQILVTNNSDLETNIDLLMFCQILYSEHVTLPAMKDELIRSGPPQ
jgi:shikimate 5-dehydrogenase